MKYVLLLVGLFFITSCSTGETPTQDPKPAPIPTVTQTSAVITEAPTSKNQAYYSELRKRCSEQSEDKKEGCSASVTKMEENGYIEVDYDTDGNTLPCPQNMKKDTIRSYGALTWCAPI